MLIISQALLNKILSQSLFIFLKINHTVIYNLLKIIDIMKTASFILIIVLSHFTINAQVTFQKAYGTIQNSVNYANDVSQTSDGGYIITGSCQIPGNSTYRVFKTNLYGDTLWTRLGVGGVVVRQTTDGGYICMGRTVLTKLDGNGNSLWAKSYGISLASIQQTSDGGYIVAGSSQKDIYLLKINANGDWHWSKTFGGLGEEEARSVQQTTDEGYIIAGKTLGSFNPGEGIYLIKTDKMGNLLWSKTYGGDQGSKIAAKQTNDGGYIIIGEIVNGSNLIKVNDNGDILWSRSLNNGMMPYTATCILQTKDGNYIVAGATSTQTKTDATLHKFTSNGNTIWIQAYGANYHQASISSVLQTSDGGYLFSGHGTYFTTFPMAYLVKTDSMGKTACFNFPINLPSDISAPKISNPTTNVTVVPLTAANVQIVDDRRGGGLINIACQNIGLNEFRNEDDFIIYPQPSNGVITLSFENLIINGNILIINALGENVYSERIFNETKKEIDLQNISSGIYFIKVLNGNSTYLKKLIME